MKLKVIIPEKRVQNTFPAVTFCVSGNINFNNAACEKLPFLQKGSKIAFFQDEEPPRDYYIMPTIANSFVVKQYLKNGKKSAIGVQCRSLSHQVRDFYGADKKKRFSMRIADMATEFNGNMYHALLPIK
jgi:hypothetical protein